MKKLIGYAMVGSSNSQRATQFYDALLAPLGLAQVEANETYTAYEPTASMDMVDFMSPNPLTRSKLRLVTAR